VGKTTASAVVTGPSSGHTAGVIGTSSDKVERARTVLDHGPPEIQSAVEAGQISLNKGYKMTQKARAGKPRKEAVETTPPVSAPVATPPRVEHPPVRLAPLANPCGTNGTVQTPAPVFHSAEARAAFADGWIRIASDEMDETWVLLYELLRIVRDQQLYANPEYMADDRPRASFQEYWEEVVQKPFATWLGLEETYHFVRDHAPELMEKTLPKATRELQARARERSRQAAQETTGGVLPRGNPTGNNQHDARDEETGNLPVSSESQPARAARNGIGERTQRKLDRLARDHPELHERVKAGDLTPHRASVLAGIVHPTLTIPADPHRAGRALARRFSRAQFSELVSAALDAYGVAGPVSACGKSATSWVVHFNQWHRLSSPPRAPPVYVSPNHPDRDRLTSRPAPPAEEGRRLATFPRGAGAELRVTLAEYEGHPYISLRCWERGRDGPLWPSKTRGLSIRLREAEDVASALVEALELAGQPAGHLGAADRGGTLGWGEVRDEASLQELRLCPRRRPVCRGVLEVCRHFVYRVVASV
jgi:hypothetical protein